MLFPKSRRRQDKPKITRRNTQQESPVISQARDGNFFPKQLFRYAIEQFNAQRRNKKVEFFLNYWRGKGILPFSNKVYSSVKSHLFSDTKKWRGRHSLNSIKNSPLPTPKSTNQFVGLFNFIQYNLPESQNFWD